ncbi:MAG: hypothetical protein J6M93_06910 [Succinivibrio sp.]|nr:hypothetical protein [Succinivibrio sp.]
MFDSFTFTVTADRVVLCFFLALGTTIALRFILGKNRELWFKRSAQRRLITMRSPVSMYLALGYPVTKQGYIVTALLILVIAMEIFTVLLI